MASDPVRLGRPMRIASALVDRSKRRLQPEFGKIDARERSLAVAREQSVCVGAPAFALRRCERGAMLIEFALVFPILMMMFLGLVEFGEAFPSTAS